MTTFLLLFLALFSVDAIKVYRNTANDNSAGSGESAAQPGQVKAQAVDSSLVPKRWIAVLYDDIPQTDDLCEDVTCLSKYDIINGIHFEATDAQLDTWAFRFEMRIKYIEEIRTIKVTSVTQDLAPNTFWGLDRIDQRDLPLDNKYIFEAGPGAGVTIYTIDTQTNIYHQDFLTSLNGGSSRITEQNPANIVESQSQCILEELAHGTHVMGIAGGLVAGVAKAATLVAVRGLKCTGETTADLVIQALNWVANNYQKPAVLSLSIGSPDRLITIGDAVTNILNLGIPVVTAAGNNDYDACFSTPSFVPGVVSVASSSTLDYISYFSNTGTCVDLFAPGEGILSADVLSNTGYRVLSGTSMSTPFVSGAVALMLQNRPLATPSLLKYLVMKVATGIIKGHPEGTNRLLFVPAMASSLFDVTPLQATSGSLALGVGVSNANLNASTSLTFRIRLTRNPLGNAVVALSLNDARRGSVSPATLFFNPSNWATYQTTTVSTTDVFAPDQIGTNFYLDMTVINSQSDPSVANDQMSAEILDQRTYVDRAGGTLQNAINITSIPSYVDVDTSKGQFFPPSFRPCSNFSVATAPHIFTHYRPTANITVNFTTCNSFYDTTLVLLWKENPASSVYSAVCNDDYYTNSATLKDGFKCGVNQAASQIVYPLVANRDYYIVVGGAVTESGVARLVASVAGDVTNYAYPPDARFDPNKPLPPAPAPPAVANPVPIIPVKGGALSQNLVFAISFGAGGIVFVLAAFVVARWIWIKMAYTRKGLPEPPMFSMPSRATLLRQYNAQRMKFQSITRSVQQSMKSVYRKVSSTTKRRDHLAPPPAGRRQMRRTADTVSSFNKDNLDGRRPLTGRGETPTFAMKSGRKGGKLRDGDDSNPVSPKGPFNIFSAVQNAIATAKSNPEVQRDEDSQTGREEPLDVLVEADEEGEHPAQNGGNRGGYGAAGNGTKAPNGNGVYHSTGNGVRPGPKPGPGNLLSDIVAAAGRAAMDARNTLQTPGLSRSVTPRTARPTPGKEMDPEEEGLAVVSRDTRAATSGSSIPVSALLRDGDFGWICGTCGRRNGVTVLSCLACSSAKPYEGQGSTLNAPSPAPPKSLYASSEVPATEFPDWTCASCRQVNMGEQNSCEKCGKGRYAHLASTPPKSGTGTPAPGPSDDKSTKPGKA